jgi:hypothetical protein
VTGAGLTIISGLGSEIIVLWAPNLLKITKFTVVLTRSAGFQTIGNCVWGESQPTVTPNNHLR